METVRIVVGIDGSEGSRRALHAAVAEVRRHEDAVLVAVHAYPYPVAAGADVVVLVDLPHDLRRAAHAALDQALAEVPTDVVVERVVEQGSAGRTLVEQSEGATLVVVGSRGRGALRSLLLGSTSQYVAAHAHCPVLVVPGAGRAEDGGADRAAASPGAGRPLAAHADVAVPYDTAIQLLAEDAHGLLEDASHGAAVRVDEVVTTLRVDLGGLTLERDVEVDVGTFEPVEMLRARVPLRWHAATGAAFFPAVEASLEVESVTLDPVRTRIRVTGDYHPPMGPLGAALDAAVGHRIAEDAVQHLVDDVAVRLARLAARVPTA